MIRYFYFVLAQNLLMESLIKFCIVKVTFLVKITRTPISFYFSLIPDLTLKSWGKKFHFSITLLKFNLIRLELIYLSLVSMGFYTFKLFFSCIFMYTDGKGNIDSSMMKHPVQI